MQAQYSLRRPCVRKPPCYRAATEVAPVGWVQVGPRTNFATAWSANAASICTSTGLTKVTRLEASRRFALQSSQPLSAEERSTFAGLVHDRMTEEVSKDRGPTSAAHFSYQIPSVRACLFIIVLSRIHLAVSCLLGVRNAAVELCQRRCAGAGLHGAGGGAGARRPGGHRCGTQDK